jgi:hypothetical protein
VLHSVLELAQPILGLMLVEQTKSDDHRYHKNQYFCKSRFISRVGGPDCVVRMGIGETCGQRPGITAVPVVATSRRNMCIA